MIFDEDWLVSQKYTRNEVLIMVAGIDTILRDKFSISVLARMGGPTDMNVIKGHKYCFIAKEFPLKLTGDIPTDTQAFASMIAGNPKRLPPDPISFHIPFEQKVTHVAMYAWREVEGGFDINNWSRDTYRIGIIRAAAFNADEIIRQ